LAVRAIRQVRDSSPDLPPPKAHQDHDWGAFYFLIVYRFHVIFHINQGSLISMPGDQDSLAEAIWATAPLM
jgi:hypothetical protein